jgi:hypothetical protein
MRYHEIISERSNKVYDWTAPITLYRGSGSGNPDAFSDTKLGYPTFTDVHLVANKYAISANDGGNHTPGGKVFAYKVKVNNPCILWMQEHGPENVVEINTLQKLFGLTDQQIIDIVHRTVQIWRTNGGESVSSNIRPEEIVAVLHGDDDYLYNHSISTDSYRIADDAAYQKLAKQKGYDSFILRGPFNGDQRDDGGGDHSLDVDGALEWKVMNPACVQLLGEVVRKDKLATVNPVTTNG